MKLCGSLATIGALIGTAAISFAGDNQKIMFAEKFTSPLSAGWHWIREDPKGWNGESKYDAKGVWFRLVIAGGQATGYYRPTAQEDWRKMGQVDLPSKDEPKAALNAGGGPENGERWARFSHFCLLEQDD